jgi:hypothetical protein
VAAAGNEEQLNYEGHAGHGLVSIASSSAGKLRELHIEWRAAECERPDFFYGETTVIGFKSRRAARTFVAHGTETTHPGQGLTAKVTVRGRGELVRSRARWEGRWSADVQVSLNGQPYDTCHLDRIKWHADLVPADYVHTGSFDLDGSPGEYVSQGEDYHYTFPQDLVSIGGTGDGFTLEVGDWNGSFGAPTKLQPGTTYENANRFGDGGNPEIDFNGMGRGCNETSGEFTINKYAIRNRQVRTVSMTFSQSCDGGDPPLLGSLNLSVHPPAFTKSRAKTIEARGRPR